MKTIVTLLIIMFSSFLKADEPLTIGTPAPAIKVVTHTGEAFDLAALYAKVPVLIYFYPKADTPGCTKQACNIRDNFAELQQAGIEVLRVSFDKIKAQAAFHEKYKLPFTLIAGGEDDHALAKSLGVGGMMGGVIKAYKRQSFLIVKGKVAWFDSSAKPSSQTADALAAYKAIKEMETK